MNQILFTENHSKQKRKKNTEMIDMRKIIIIFSILIIIFALVIVVAKVYGMIRENKEKGDSPVIELNKPSITIERIEGICSLEVEYDEGLEKVTYWWNEGDDIVKNLNGSTRPFSTQIIIPEGERNVLHVKATGVDGSINEQTKEFVVEQEIEEPNKPKISWNHYEGTTKMDITVTSDKGIENLTYNWEGEEEITIPATEENQKEIRVTIDVKRGTNKLYVKAKDIEGNEQSKSEIINGIMKPEFDLIIENNILKITVKHDMGFKKVIIKINEEELIYDETNPQYSESTTILNTNIEIPPDISKIEVEIKAYTLEEPDKEYEIKRHANLR